MASNPLSRFTTQPFTPLQGSHPGIGVEFETNRVALRTSNPNFSDRDLQNAKGKVLANRKGRHWKLTGDDTPGGGLLHAEYILDGRRLKLGSGKAARAARRVENDLEDWCPRSNAPNFGSFVWVKGEKIEHLNPFIIMAPGGNEDQNRIIWSRQVTAPMPLRVINRLMGQVILREAGPLLPGVSTFERRMVWVRPGYFQSRPQGINPRHLTEDALGFFALVLSYAKSSASPRGSSPKFLTSIMPRTNFPTMFLLANLHNILRDMSFYESVKIAACYGTDGMGFIDIDPRYSNGTLQQPLPNNRLDTTQFVIGQNQISVRDWIEGTQHGTDSLSKFDNDHADTQIGALGTRTERVFGRLEPAPIFEFRDLGSSKRETFVRDVVDAEGCVIKLHLAS